jgi:hypothetical protein
MEHLCKQCDKPYTSVECLVAEVPPSRGADGHWYRCYKSNGFLYWHANEYCYLPPEDKDG